MAKLIGRRTTPLSEMAHVTYNGAYYIISSSFINGETIIFKSNKDGEIVSYVGLGAANDIQDGIDNFKDRFHEGSAF